MNAGELSIRITAEMAQFDRSMVDMTTRAGTAGRAAGQEYSSQFGRFADSMKQRLQSSLAGAMKGILNPVGVGMAFVDGITNAIKTGNVAQAYVDMVQSLPIAGTFANLLVSIYDMTSGEMEEAAKRAQHASTEAFRRQISNERKAKEKRDEEELARVRMEKAKEVEGMRRSILDATADVNSLMAKKAGDEERAVAFQLDRDLIRLQEDRRQQEIGATEEEKKTINELYVLRRRAIFEEGEAKMKAIRDAKKEQEKAAKEAAEAEEILNIQKTTEEFKRFQELQERIADETKKLEAERIDAQTAGVTEANTALGSFTFDAYPAADKKRNDERIVKAIETVAKTSLGFGGFS